MSSATLRPRRHQLSGCAAPLPCALFCRAVKRSPPCDFSKGTMIMYKRYNAGSCYRSK